MNWKEIWNHLFGATQMWGINMGFWVGIAVVALIVAVMNLIFWSMKPKKGRR